MGLLKNLPSNFRPSEPTNSTVCFTWLCSCLFWCCQFQFSNFTLTGRWPFVQLSYYSWPIVQLTIFNCAQKTNVIIVRLGGGGGGGWGSFQGKRRKRHLLLKVRQLLQYKRKGYEKGICREKGINPLNIVKGFFLLFFLCIFFSQVRNIPERIILISTTGLR